MHINIQPIEKLTQGFIGKLDVHSIFHTIQGEGPFCGTPAIFIRLAGCNLRCPGCDTDYTSTRRQMYPYEILEALRLIPHKTKLIVVTGGEPFRQTMLRHLLYRLVRNKYYVQIETNGTLRPQNLITATNNKHKDLGPCGYNTNPCERNGVYIVVSPKAGRVHTSIWENACCAKYVISHKDYNHNTGLPLHALQHPANPHVAYPPNNFKKPVYLQPMDEQDKIYNERNLDLAVKCCLEHGYILQLQVHKLIGVD